MRSISASIIQGSSLGPASYAVTAVDLKPLHANNSLVKFADDTYLVVPAECANSRAAELDNIAAWAAKNLQLNKLKTREVLFHDSRRRHSVQSPPLLPVVARDTTLKSSASPSAATCRRLTTSAVCDKYGRQA